MTFNLSLLNIASCGRQVWRRVTRRRVGRRGDLLRAARHKASASPSTNRADACGRARRDLWRAGPVAPGFSAKKVLSIAIFSVCFIAVSSQNAYAIFNLSVAPRRGGQDIRFEAAGPGGLLRNEEVTVSVVTDKAVQYRITQTVYQPLTNELGQTIPQGAFIVFSPSSPMGTLRTELETPVTMGQTQIFTSNAAGDPDSFVLVFNVRVPENQAGGVYRARLTFMAEPVIPKSGATPSVVNLDAVVEVRPDFRIVVHSAQGGRNLDFGRISKDRLSADQNVKIEIESNIGKTYRITQQLTDALASPEGQVLDETGFRFTSAGGEHGTLAGKSGATQIPTSSALLYTSNPAGGGDVIQIQYHLTPDTSQKAGVYSGNLALKVESDSSLAHPEVFNLPVKVEVEPIFYLDTVMEEVSGIHFGTFKTGTEKQEKRVVLTVHSNLGQSYQVSQILSRKLMNEEGVALPPDHFVFFGSDAQTGTLAVMSPTAVKEGESVVFTSDKKGTSEKFVLNYTLTVPSDARAGSYRSELKYSITTL